MHHAPARLLAAALALGVPLSARADTSATLATAINLPRGPASIEGFGAGYDVSPASALPSLSYTLEVPPGRAGHAPELALHYHPGSGSDVLGLGWSLRIPAIERSLRAGIPRWGGDDPWTLKNLGDGEELIVVAPGLLRQRIEHGPPIEVTVMPDGSMVARTTDGMRLLFGLSPDARLARGGDAFRLELSAVVDPNGNRVDYTWSRLPGSDAPLLTSITWNDGAAAVHFDYEPRPDPVISRASGFRVALVHRLAAIRTAVAGEPVRTTELRYTTRSLAPSSQLVEIATSAADGTALPTWRLQYTTAADTLESFTLDSAPALDPTAEGRAWLDVDGDALPELLEGAPGAWRYRKNLGGRSLGLWLDLANAPAAAIGPTARFADLTGDGVQDLLDRPTDGDAHAFLGGGERPFEQSAPIPLDVGFDLADPRVALVDLNLDGRIDVLRHDDGDGWVWLQRWEGPGFHAAEPIPPPPAGLRLGDPGVQLADMDGDRLPDLVRVLRSERRILIAASAGLGFFDDPTEMEAVPEMSEADRWELADVTGDGAADLVRIGRADVSLWVNHLDGSYFAAGAHPWPELEADEVALLSDVDGSGTLDVLRADTDGSKPWRYWSWSTQRPGLLEAQENGLGYRLGLRYRPAAALAAEDAAAGAPWSVTPPEAAPVLVTVIESDGLSWTRTTKYHPREGWYDPSRGELRGFAAHVHTREGDAYSSAAITTRRYDLGRTDEARGLQLLEETIAGPVGALVRELHTVEVQERAPGVRAARRIATDTLHLEGGPEDAAALVRTEWDHDDAGNIIEERALGIVDRKTGADISGDERITTTIYAAPTGPDGPRDRPAEILVTDGDGAQVSATRNYYDGEPEQGLELGEVGPRGLLTRALVWADADNWLTSLRQTHDARGNVTRIRDAEDGVLERRYDPIGLFTVEERLLLDEGALVTTAAWDPRHGHPIAVTGPNGATARAQYDGLGRLIAEIQPGDTAERPTLRYRYFLDGRTDRPTIVTERRRRSGEDDVDLELDELDGLGRLHARVTANDAGTGAVLARGVLYDAAGLPAEQIEGESLPAAALTPGARIDFSSAWPRTQTWRDALGRTTATRDPDGFETLTRYTPLAQEDLDNEDIRPEPPYTTSPDRREFDGLGRTVAEHAILPDRTVTHRYEYDAAGRLRAHIDPAGHASRYAHDGAGRLHRIDTPDAGTIRQRFDATGQIVERIDATGARVTRTYDRIGRPLEQRAYSARGESAGEVRYTYDRSQDPAAAYARGQLTAVEDAAGRVDFDHDARGRVIRTTRRFGAHGGPVTLSYSTEYDAQDRVVRDVFPDGADLQRDYTARGLEVPVAGWITGAAYDPRGRWTDLQLASGVRITRTLDSTGRLLTHRVAADSADLLRLNHRYDVAGLLAESRDQRDPGQSQRFTHDDMRRLVRAEGPYGTQTFAYSDDDNIIRARDAAFGYGAAQPHAVTAAHGQNFVYDDAGRLSAVEGEGPVPAGTWRSDPHGRVQSFVDEDGRRTEHIYDHAGAEAIRREFNASGGLAHETLYFSPQVEVRDGRLVRWVLWNGERIAESPAPLPDATSPRLPLAAATLLLLFALGVLLLGASRRRRAWTCPATSRPLRLAGQVALVVLAAMSCHTDAGSVHPLVPDEHARYHVQGRLGSAALVLDHHGEVLARDAHDPYGTPVLTWRADGERGADYRFAGAEDTPRSGAVVLGARHYLPALGRFTAPDPFYLFNPGAHLDRPGERNLYRYAANSPTQHVDPTGHGWISWVVKIGRRIVKGADKADEASSMAEDAMVMFGGDASFGARVISAISLATEYLPVSAGDVKDGIRWARGTNKAADAATTSSLRLGSYSQLRDARARDAHHIIQDKAAQGLPGYKKADAPSVQLDGPSTAIGSPHYRATAIQRQAGGGTYAAERRIGYKALRAAGLSPEQSRQAIEFADRYFQQLGVTPSTPTTIPGNRR
jgi:RHS repeat-associated protein